MDSISYKTEYVNKATTSRQWVVVDAGAQSLGRLTSQVASILRGKHKPHFTPHVACGDHVIVLNADKIALSGDKLDKKAYIRYSGYPGGTKRTTPKKLQGTHPRRIIEHAIKGMLPKNKLGRRLFHQLYIYSGTIHPHGAQKPKILTLQY